jgi:N-acetylglucosaminyldiphosphoundecaprenol N-acetyl-beta-D-mannosaminyltransferase
MIHQEPMQPSLVSDSIVRAPVLGLPIAVCNYSEAVALLRAWAQNPSAPYLVAAANTHLVTTARSDKQFATAMEKFDLVVPDGMPLVWYMNQLCDAGLKDRVYGPDLMRHSLAATDPTHRHFLLGGTEEERQRLEQVLREKYPRARVLGSYSPPFGNWTFDEDEKIIGLLRNVKPNFVWVGLGCPKQELLLARLKDALPPAVYVAVGAAFSLISGTVKQAPPSWQRLGLEWAFRLFMEPRRLWRRYLVNNTLFIFYTISEIVRRKCKSGDG